MNGGAVLVGDEIEYTIHVVNTGARTARGVCIHLDREPRLTAGDRADLLHRYYSRRDSDSALRSHVLRAFGT